MWCAIAVYWLLYVVCCVLPNVCCLLFVVSGGLGVCRCLLCDVSCLFVEVVVRCVVIGVCFCSSLCDIRALLSALCYVMMCVYWFVVCCLLVVLCCLLFVCSFSLMCVD